MYVNMITPKYFMMNCKFIGFASQPITYENYLIEVINHSNFFRSKCPFYEQYKLIEDESHGDDDIKCSQYSLDFKLLVDEDIMRVMNKNMPEIDYSKIKDGFVFINTKKDPLPVPDNTLLIDLITLKKEDVESNKVSKTIKNICKNIKKEKNLFFYYPYEFSADKNITPLQFEKLLTSAFSVIMNYRNNEQNNHDTFICIKSNSDFLIYEWTNNKFNFIDKVSEFLCSNYRDVKLYSLY